MVGLVTAPTKARSTAEPNGVHASFSPSLGNADGGTHARGLATTVFTRVDSGFGVNWYEHIDAPKAAALAVEPEPDLKGKTARPAKHAIVDPSVVPVSKRAKKAARTVERVKALAIEPAPERFAGKVTPTDPRSPLLLAFADPAPNAAGGVLDAMAAPDGIPPLPAIADVVAPEHASLPDTVPLPEARPRVARAEAKPDAADEFPPKPEVAELKPAKPAKPEKPDVDDATRALLPASKSPRDNTGTKLAFARPNNPSTEESTDRGGIFKSLFSRPDKPRAAGNGVAVYDISAARVYMPDGSVLEAHSGIGKMADNPAYVHVKMNGPTPPHTYRLKMREKRFHGVEAIRMLPVDGKNKHGRDGFLTHSYLLRSRMAQSHGCVAFKDYPKFLNAFKAGKVHTLVVVSGGGRKAATQQMAKNGQGA
ncbi:MAG: tlde1 domain-containing protein [Rhizobiaceae bacterium]